MDRRAFRVDPRLLGLAREMRSGQTPAEEKLWCRLRNRRLNGLKFRRQFAVDRYIADFYCAECRLIVELDGPSHADPHQADHDDARTADLTALGYRVVRYRNADVHENLDGVLKDLLRRCEQVRNPALGPSPRPSPPSTGAGGHMPPAADRRSDGAAGLHTLDSPNEFRFTRRVGPRPPRPPEVVL